MSRRAPSRRPAKHSRDVDSPARRSPRVATGAPARRLRWLPLSLILLTLAAGGIYWAYRGITPTPQVVSPAEPGRLDAQVRAYIEEKVAWAKSAPREAPRHAELGLVYQANKLWPEARACFHQCATLDRKDPLPRLYAAGAAQRTGDIDEALAALEKLVADYPDFAPAHYRYADLLVNAGRLDDAAVHFQRVIDLAGTQPYGFLGLGDVKLQLGKPADAVPLLERAVRLAPRLQSARYLLGTAYRAQGRHEQAQLELAQGAEAQRPSMPDDWTDRLRSHAKGLDSQMAQAMRLCESGLADQAITLMETVLKWHPDSVDVLNNLAICCLKARRFVRADECLKRSIQLAPERFETYINLASASLDAGRPEEALGWSDRSVELGGHVAQTHLTRARILRALRRNPEVVAALEKAVSAESQNPDLLAELGCSLLVVQRADEAQSRLVAALRLAPTSVSALLGMCELFLQRRDFPRAHEYLDKARQVVPGSPMVAEMAKRLQRAEAP